MAEEWSGVGRRTERERKRQGGREGGGTSNDERRKDSATGKRVKEFLRGEREWSRADDRRREVK